MLDDSSGGLMTETLRVEIKGLEELQRKLDMADETIKRELAQAMEKAVSRIWDSVAKYPNSGPAPGEWAAMTTPAQKAAFFAQMREGGWQGQTGTLGRLWKGKVHSTGGGIKGVVSNTVPYAIFVQGSKQAPFHAGRWQTAQQVVEKEQGKVNGYFEQAMARITEAMGD